MTNADTPDLAALAAKLRALRAEWGDAVARSAFEQQAAVLAPADRDRLAVLVFGADNVGVGKAGADGRIETQGIVNVSGSAHIYGPTIGINLGKVIYERDPREEERRQLVWYLDALANKLYRLPLRGLDNNLEDGDGLAMPRIYVALKTTAKGSALQAVSDQPRMVLLGEPGSGKSTFVRHLAWALAQRVLDPTRSQTLLPQADFGSEQLPLLLPLRTLAQCLDRDGASVASVRAALLTVLREDTGEQAETLLREALHSGAALLLFDGLDEVPLEAIAGTTASRATVVQAIRDFCQTHPKARALVTCRTRAFDTQCQAMLGWHAETLEPFTHEQMRTFAGAWYGELVMQGQVEPSQAPRLATALMAVIERSPKLSAMAGTPLLLTMMALVLYNKGELPRDRPRLYEAVLELLLGQWDKMRDGQSLSEAIGLPDWDGMRFRLLLDQLSYQAHLKASSRDGRGRLARGMVYDALIAFFKQAALPEHEAWAAAGRCLEYFNQRSGLLVPDDAKDSYVFVHLTLQEHCAGRYIALGPDAADLVLRHRADDRWREAIFLGLGVAQQYNPTLLDRVLSDLIDRQEGPADKPPDRWARDLVLADEIGQDRDWSYLRALRINVDRLQRELKRNMEICLTCSCTLDSRLQVGKALGRLGDQRIPVTLDAWRGELARRNEQFGNPAGYWCYVRSGTYRIGGWEAHEHSVEVNLPAFWLARYPVAVAQYAPFVEVGYGPDAERWWTPQGWRWKQAQRRKQPWGWDDPRYNAANQPVTGVTWYDATAFCAWLTEQLADQLPHGYLVCLPSEAEWEAAASYAPGAPRRTYPWGEQEPTPERAIYNASGLDAPAPVGSCPAGAAACGALDMAGNVWEVTTSSYEQYPIKSATLKKDFTNNTGDVPLRGGAYWNESTYVRCGARDWGHLNYGYDGFRIVVAPRAH